MIQCQTILEQNMLQCQTICEQEMIQCQTICEQEMIQCQTICEQDMIQKTIWEQEEYENLQKIFIQIGKYNMLCLIWRG